MAKPTSEASKELARIRKSMRYGQTEFAATKLEGWRVRAVVVGIIHARTGQPGPNLEYDDGSPLIA